MGTANKYLCLYSNFAHNVSIKCRAIFNFDMNLAHSLANQELMHSLKMETDWPSQQNSRERYAPNWTTIHTG